MALGPFLHNATFQREVCAHVDREAVRSDNLLHSLQYADQQNFPGLVQAV